MSWELRSGIRYFYEAFRDEDGKLVKRYVGNGLAGLLASRQAEEAAERRKQLIQEVRDFEAGMWHLDSATRLIREASKEALHATYLVAGYRQNKFYHWRRSPEMKEQHKEVNDLKEERSQQRPGSAQAKHVKPVSAEDAGIGMATAAAETRLPESIDETLAAIKQGRTDLLGHLRQQLRRVPQLWQHYGDLGRLTQVAWASQIAGDVHLVRESLMLQMDRQRQELAGDNPSAAERLLAERVVLANLQLAFYEQLAAQNAPRLLGTKLGEAVAKRLKSANHELRQATSQLTKIKQLQSASKPHRPAAALKLFDPDRKQQAAA